MARRRDTVLAHWDASGRCYLRRHLCTWQDPAMPRLGALAELDLDHFDLFRRRLFLKTDGVEIAIRGPASKIAASEFPRKIATMLPVITADASLAGIVGEAAKL